MLLHVTVIIKLSNFYMHRKNPIFTAYYNVYQNKVNLNNCFRVMLDEKEAY